QLLQGILCPECLHVGVVRDQVHEQDVAGPQLGLRGGLDKNSAAFERDEVCAGGVAQPQFADGLADKGRAVHHAHTVLAVRQVVLLIPVGQTRTAGYSGLRIVTGGQPAPREDHVGDTEGQDWYAERREAEKVKTRGGVTRELAVDDQVRRRRDQ